MDNKPSPQLKEEKKVGIGAYIALIFAIVIFSGVFYQMPEARKWLSAFDFTTLIGKFGVTPRATTSVRAACRLVLLFCLLCRLFPA